MSFSRENKQETIREFATADNDTGSPQVQIALLTTRIRELTEHLQKHRHDFSSKRGLLQMVNRRKKLLKYLQKNDNEKYHAILTRLALKR